MSGEKFDSQTPTIRFKKKNYGYGRGPKESNKSNVLDKITRIYIYMN